MLGGAGAKKVTHLAQDVGDLWIYLLWSLHSLISQLHDTYYLCEIPMAFAKNQELLIFSLSRSYPISLHI